MQTECIPALMEFPAVEGRRVVAAFDGGAITSDAGALLLGQADRAIGLTERFAACFTDVRVPELVEHEVSTLVMQRVVGIARDCLEIGGVRLQPLLAGADRWRGRISVRSRSQACHYRRRSEPGAGDRRPVATSASTEIYSSGGSPGSWPCLR